MATHISWRTAFAIGHNTNMYKHQLSCHHSRCDSFVWLSESSVRAGVSLFQQKQGYNTRYVDCCLKNVILNSYKFVQPLNWSILCVTIVRSCAWMSRCQIVRHWDDTSIRIEGRSILYVYLWYICIFVIHWDCTVSIQLLLTATSGRSIGPQSHGQLINYIFQYVLPLHTASSGGSVLAMRLLIE